MGELIRFRPRHGARPEPIATANAGPAGKEGATILLFLGVRYERHDDQVARSTKRQIRRGSRVKRA